MLRPFLEGTRSTVHGRLVPQLAARGVGMLLDLQSTVLEWGADAIPVAEAQRWHRSLQRQYRRLQSPATAAELGGEGGEGGGGEGSSVTPARRPAASLEPQTERIPRAGESLWDEEPPAASSLRRRTSADFNKPVVERAGVPSAPAADPEPLT